MLLGDEPHGRLHGHRPVVAGVLQPGQAYNVSAWVRLVNGGNQTMQLTMQKTDGGVTTFAAIASGSVSSNSWTQLAGQYTYNPTGTVSVLTFYAEMPSKLDQLILY